MTRTEIDAFLAGFSEPAQALARGLIDIVRSLGSIGKQGHNPALYFQKSTGDIKHFYFTAWLD